MLALEKSESDRMEQEVRLAPAAALVSWRLDQSVRDTTARRQLDAIRRLAQPVTDSPFEALLRMVRLLRMVELMVLPQLTVCCSCIRIFRAHAAARIHRLPFFALDLS
jgi:hypothetical protein